MKKVSWQILIGLCLIGFIMQGCSTPKAKNTDNPGMTQESKTATLRKTQTNNAVTERPSAEKQGNLTPYELREMIASNEDMIILDVRDPQELKTWPEQLDKAVNIPLSELATRYTELPHDKKIVVVCKSGRRSAQAVELLRNSGFENIYNLEGGMTAFRQTEAQ